MNRNLTYKELKQQAAQEAYNKELRMWLSLLLFIGLVVLPIFIGDPS